jgi:predicted HTH domain antitoxin
MTQIVLEISDRSLEALSGSPQMAGKELRLAAAMKLYEIGRLTSGGAAELAGVARVEFLARLHDYNVPTFRLTEEELREDVERPARGSAAAVLQAMHAPPHLDSADVDELDRAIEAGRMPPRFQGVFEQGNEA